MFHFLAPMMPSLSSVDAIFISHNGKCVFSQIANTLPECVKHNICLAQYYSTSTLCLENKKAWEQSRCMRDTKLLLIPSHYSDFVKKKKK